MRITEAAQRLGTSPRMLRYRESLGLLPGVRPGTGRRYAPGSPGRQPPPGRGSEPAARTPRAGTDAAIRTGPAARGSATAGRNHRQFSQADLAAVALGLAIEQRYDISPAALAFGLRVLADPRARAEVTELGTRIGRIRPLPVLAVDFEKERAARLLGSPAGRGISRG